ncbi:MAG: hypothetical protein D6812_00965 [Deltaproteobacteria bacterium]|nr:MAG: hypothetical protein D6812_00965 [Deltaproteobacteria bacterium]
MIPICESIFILVIFLCWLHGWKVQGREFFLLFFFPAFLFGVFTEEMAIAWNDLYRLQSGFWFLANVPVTVGLWWSYLLYLALYLSEGLVGGSLSTGKGAGAVLGVFPLVTGILSLALSEVWTRTGLIAWFPFVGGEGTMRPAGRALLLALAHAGGGGLFVLAFHFLLNRAWKNQSRVLCLMLAAPLLALLSEGWFWGVTATVRLWSGAVGGFLMGGGR